MIHADGLGSVSALTDESGEPVQTYAYAAFGGIREQTGTDLNRVTFTAREALGDSLGLFYYRHRIYDPHTGRFTSEDPLGFVDGANRYVYVGNNPVNYVDPFGLSPFVNNSDQPIPYKPESVDNKVLIAQPGETVDADGVYSPNGTAGPTLIKIPDNMQGSLSECGQLSVTSYHGGGKLLWLGNAMTGFWKLTGYGTKKLTPRSLTPTELQHPDFRSWPDPYSGRNWPYEKWEKPKPSK